MKKFAISCIVIAAVDMVACYAFLLNDKMTAMGWSLVCAGIFVWLGLILLGLNKIRERNVGF
jgi:hypothetical protein